MDTRTVAFGVAVVGAALLACATGPKAARNTTRFDEYGFRHTEYHYRVLEKPDVAGTTTNGLMDGDWFFDNLYSKNSKEPELVPKETAEYLTSYAFDLDGDGKTDSTEQGYLYDLRFKHRSRDSIIFIRTIPISGELRDKDLRVLTQRYIDAVSGAGYEAVQLNGQTVVSEQRFAAELRERGAANLAGQEAYQATFDVANVDQLRVSPNARRTRVRLVLVRTPFEYEAGKQPGRPKGVTYPVLLLAGYATLPEDFGQDLPAFMHLLKRIQFGTTVGYTAEPVEVLSGAPAALASASAPPAPAPPAPAPPAPAPPPSASAEPAAPPPPSP